MLLHVVWDKKKKRYLLFGLKYSIKTANQIYLHLRVDANCTRKTHSGNTCYSKIHSFIHSHVSFL